jgi:hypothetical protein
MSVPSANTRARRNMSRTASQPLSEKPASTSTGCAGVEMASPIAPMTRLKSCRARSVHREQPREDPVVQGNRDDAEDGHRAQAHSADAGGRVPGPWETAPRRLDYDALGSARGGGMADSISRLAILVPLLGVPDRASTWR